MGSGLDLCLWHKSTNSNSGNDEKGSVPNGTNLSCGHDKSATYRLVASQSLKVAAFSRMFPRSGLVSNGFSVASPYRNRVFLRSLRLRSIPFGSVPFWQEIETRNERKKAKGY